ncbi:ankyrin repeat-containing domain protein [Mariannaea sp. PMI_226]|nr:ankyrin repeat-containing domain protein [Mariannaea sp. PMI_226]
MPNADIYTVGWICAIKPEYVAAQSFLDEKHDRPDHVSTNDSNIYTLGRVGKHNVVIGVMPDGEYGIAGAVGVAKGMLISFSNVRIGLMVGIGGGAPSPKNDIRLGDIVVSAPRDGHGGVFQYDFGKTIQGQTFQTSGFLNQPPELLRAAIADIQAEYEMDGHQLEEAINGVFGRKPRLRRNYQRPGEGSDKLFQSRVVHRETGASCTTDCYDGPSSLVERCKRTDVEDNPAIHYGTIASANQLMKDALVRDKLVAEKNVLCFEMEAAGLMNRFPCIVIRGICDYSDSHKNKEWQGYAAMAAAAYAKDLLCRIPPSKVEAERQISAVLESLQEKLDRVHLTADETNHAVIAMKSDHHLANVKRWLSPPDHVSNLKVARERRHHNTGIWLLDSPAYNEWKLGSRQHLWLYGLAGCGKTVLSTRIIDNLLQTDTNTTLFFFFDFNDPGKQTLESLLRSLVFQLYHLGGEAVSRLDRLFTSHDNGQIQLDMSALSDYIKLIMQTDRKVVLIIDALDECITRKDLLHWLRDFTSSHSQLIVTGRPEAEFQCEIAYFLDERNCILLDKKAVNLDIRSYVTARLKQDPDFTSKNLSQDTALGSLPSDLNETYSRMLQNIPIEFQSGAIRLLQFLVYAKRPLMLSEAVEVIATEIDREPRGFHEERRLFQETDVLKYCPSLVSIVPNTTRIRTIEELHLAHFSVKEFLLKNAQFSLESASIIITRTCLTYLTDLKGDLHQSKIKFPMARYAAAYWMDYATSAETSRDIVERAVGFLQNEITFQRWCLLYSTGSERADHLRFPQASRLYYACLGGIAGVARSLLGKGANVNAQGGYYGNALQAATKGGHREIVQLLLDNGADVNTQGGQYGNALRAASIKGYQEIVQLLLDNGANINAEGGLYGNALYAASEGGYQEIVQLLLDKGANGNYSNALYAASEGGYQEIVQLLLDKGANGNYSNALQAALIGGHQEIVQLLLDKGADVNTQGGQFGNALQAASIKGYQEIVQLLLDKGVDVNAQGGTYGNALQAASIKGCQEIVQLLLDNGANINAEGGLYGNALYAASEGGHREIVQLLLDNGADVNTQGGQYGNALRAASFRGHQEVVRLLLDKGANGVDINAQGGYYGNALQAASIKGYQEIVQLLLDNGADVNTQGGQYGNALRAASLRGHQEIVQLLLDNGANINAASKGGHQEIVQLLMQRSAKSRKRSDSASPRESAKKPRFLDPINVDSGI